MLNYQNDSNVRLIKNNTGADVGQYQILKLDGPVFTPTDNSTGWLQRQTFKGITPTDSCDFAITQRAVPDGKAQPAIFAGVSPCTIDVTDASHTHAVAGTTAAKLVSAASGPAKILWKESGTGDKNAVVQLSQGGSGATEPVIACHSDYLGYSYRGLSSSNLLLYSGGVDRYGTAQTVNFLTRSNDHSVIGPSGVSSRYAIKSPGVFAYSIPWAIRINDPPPEQTTVGLLTLGVEFSYDGSGHVDGIRNAPAAEGNYNPFATLYTYPTVEISAFLYDAQRTTVSSGVGIIFAAEKACGGFDTQIRSGGTDSNFDTYEGLWEDYLDGGALGRTWHGCISGAFAISQESLDNLQGGGASVGVEFSRGAINGGDSDFNWQFAVGGFVIYSPSNPLFYNELSIPEIGTIPSGGGVNPTTG